MASSTAKNKEAEAARQESQSPPPFSPAPSYHSDDEEEEGEGNIEQTISADRSSVEYGIYHTKALTHMIVCSAATARKKPLYFVEVSEFTFKKPDVQLRQIPEDLAESIPIGSELSSAQGRTAPIIALARFPTLSRDFTIGFGDPSESEEQMVWEKVKNAQRINHGQYDFFYTNPLEGPSAAPVKYSWHRTHDEADGISEKSKWKRMMNFRCWKLVDHRSGRIIALVTANLLKRWSKEGKMLIYDGREKELEVMIFLSYCAISEKGRRRENRRRSGGHGGGGGGG